MDRKYFPFDKNYILKEAQATSRDTLLLSLVQTVNQCYQSYQNPLGLVDDTIEKLQEYEPGNLHFFHDFYDDLAGIYRYKYGEVQLEFLWDGTTHADKYQEDWERTFLEWIRDFCHHPTFVRAVFELTVFHSPLARPELVQNRLKAFLVTYFDLKIYIYRGIQEIGEVA